MRIPTSLMPHTVTYETRTGAGAFGELYDPEATERCMARGQRRLVRTADGAEATSTLTLYLAPGLEDAFTPGTRVTWGTTTTTVIAAIPQDDGNLGTPQHTEVACE